MSAESQPNPVAHMFTWWNAHFRSGAPFTGPDFQPFFDTNGALVVNGELRGRGLDALAAHFERIRMAVPKVEIVLPFEYSFGNTENVFVHYTARSVGADGKPACENAMGYARMTGGRIAVMSIVATTT